MTEPVFRDSRDVTVEARPTSLWTLALPYVAGAVRIRIAVTDANAKWDFGVGPCGPGGTYKQSAAAILPFAPLGSLIAKIGGGDAECPGLPTAAGAAPQALTTSKLFAVGTYCVIDLKAGDSGPLFLTMNDEVANFVNHSGQVTAAVAVAIG